MLSSNLLKSKFPFVGGGGFAEFDVEFKFAKIQNSHFVWGGGGWGVVGGTNFQLLMLSPKFAKKKIFAKNFLSFQAKIGKVLFWILKTEWFAIRSIANHNKIS